MFNLLNTKMVDYDNIDTSRSWSKLWSENFRLRVFGGYHRSNALHTFYAEDKMLPKLIEDDTIKTIPLRQGFVNLALVKDLEQERANGVKFALEREEIYQSLLDSGNCKKIHYSNEQ